MHIFSQGITFPLFSINWLSNSDINAILKEMNDGVMDGELIPIN